MPAEPLLDLPAGHINIYDHSIFGNCKRRPASDNHPDTFRHITYSRKTFFVKIITHPQRSYITEENIVSHITLRHLQYFLFRLHQGTCIHNIVTPYAPERPEHLIFINPGVQFNGKFITVSKSLLYDFQNFFPSYGRNTGYFCRRIFIIIRMSHSLICLNI